MVTKQVEMVATGQEQLQRWLEGRSCHTPVGHDFECCPDFSCCYPSLMATQEERERFIRGDRKTRDAMCGSFLVRLMELNVSDGKVHVIG